MEHKLNIFKCNICGNIVESVYDGGGELVCCGQPMELLLGKTSDAGLEKHVPVIEKNGDKIVVKIGSVPHPMEEKHYIQWIELVFENGSCRKFLSPGQKPEVEFLMQPGTFYAREYCNIHGLWKSVTSG